jgi:nucleoside-diphosphate-sugar epimerase
MPEAMKCIVTGALGFIGSHLCDELLRLGHHVVGLDGLIPSYPEVIKQRNLISLLAHPNFRGFRVDLRTDPLDRILSGADAIFHLAAVSSSTQNWSESDHYLNCNVRSTQRLLEVTRTVAPGVKRFICASASSVYGRNGIGNEALPTKPISLVGATKLAAEGFCNAYGHIYGLPIVVLRYFSVYGPRQRPDMGCYRFIDAMLHDEPVTVYGDGHDVRGCTHVSDCVAATIAALEAPPGETYNVGGSEATSALSILKKLESLSGRRVTLEHQPAQPGEPRHAFADTSKIHAHLGWMPVVSLDEGLQRQWNWQRGLTDPEANVAAGSVEVRGDSGQPFPADTQQPKTQAALKTKPKK